MIMPAKRTGPWAAFAAVFAALICNPAFSQTSPAGEVIPIQAWVHDPVLASLALSPDGKHLVAVSLPDMNSVPTVAIWNVDELSQPPVRFGLTERNGARWKPLQAFWLNDDVVYAIGRQTLDISVGARKIRTFRSKAFVYDLKKKKLLEPFGGSSSRIEDLFGEIALVDRLPLDSKKVLVSEANQDGAVDIFEMDLDKYNLKRVFRGAPGTSAFIDMEGHVRGRTRIEGSGDSTRLEVEARKVGSDSWEEVSRFYAKDREGLQPAGFARDPNVLYMTDNKGREHTVLREYDIATGKLSEPVFAHAKYDAVGIVVGTTRKKYGEVLGFRYDGPRVETYWVDPDRVALQNGLDKAFPGKFVTLGSFSDDETRAVIMVSASNDPGTYYLYDSKKGLIELGRPKPSLDPDRIAETKLVYYKARDGLEIPAFLTLPKRGKPPYPTVVMPHGGPWARDYIDYDWSNWRPFLADRGYAVLQPQYRGSEGWGQTLWRAGDREWGQTMQDDKDDGARWLVEQGVADPKRLAIYGFSYGGYAAMASIVRPNPPWKCAIAGAGLSELRTFDRITFDNRFGREFQNPTIAGLSPLDHVEDASIPILIFHGDRDQTVPIEQSEKYYEALKKAGKDVKYVEISDYGHGPSVTVDKQAQVLELLASYLRDDCGMGGL